MTGHTPHTVDPLAGAETGSDTRERRQTLTQQAVARLRRNIMRNVYPPETHLQEIPLSQDLSMSRTPVREALATLANEGLLLYAPKRGYTVRKFSLEDVMDAYSVRGALEGMACRVLAERGIEDTISAELRQMLVTVDDLLADGRLDTDDCGPWRAANIRFHTLLQSATGNQFLTAGLGQVNDIPLVSHAVIQSYSYDAVRRYHDDHHAILNAIVARQGSRAEAIMREHIMRAGEFVRHYLSDHSDEE